MSPVFLGPTIEPPNPYTWKWKCVLSGHDWVGVTGWPDTTPIPDTHACRQCDRCGKVQYSFRFDPNHNGRPVWEKGYPPAWLKPKNNPPKAQGLRTGVSTCSNPDHTHWVPRPSEPLECGLTAQERGTLG
jgi:hypothetical protein